MIDFLGFICLHLWDEHASQRAVAPCAEIWIGRKLKWQKLNWQKAELVSSLHAGDSDTALNRWYCLYLAMVCFSMGHHCTYSGKNIAARICIVYRVFLADGSKHHVAYQVIIMCIALTTVYYTTYWADMCVGWLMTLWYKSTFYLAACWHCHNNTALLTCTITCTCELGIAS